MTDEPVPVGSPPDFQQEVGDSPSLYTAVGGAATFRAIAARFYALVADDPELRPLYPEADLGPAEERLRTYLAQFWGGPRDYTVLRGRPQLRARHAAFPIGPAARNAWVRCMRAAVEETVPDGPHRDHLFDHLRRTATSLVNGAHGPARSAS